MPFDGIFLHFLLKEISVAVGARVDKIYQPSRDELVLALRGRDCNKKLLLCSRANSPRIHFTDVSIENPAVPPMFCMLLRKRLSGAKITAIEQNGFDRVLTLTFETYNELGDMVTLKMAVEIMGRCSNIVLIDENSRVIDSIKRVDDEMSSQRLVLPGLFYQPVPAQDKLSADTDCEACLERILSCRELPLSKAILDSVMGVSPLVARELSAFCDDRTTGLLSEGEKNTLTEKLTLLSRSMKEKGTPVMLTDADAKPSDFSYMPITQYGSAMTVTKYDSYSRLLDEYYSRRDLRERMKVKSADISRLVSNAFERASRKYAAQTKELKASEDREKLRSCGDIITANMHLLKKGMTSARLVNYYSPECEEVTVKLDAMLTPSQNAQSYYKRYKRAQSAEEHLKQELQKGLEEMDYLDSVLDALSRASTERELAEIRAELTGQGYIRSSPDKRRKLPAALPPLKFTSDDGFTILIGRNNVQNDQLTLKQSQKDDIWLHTLKIPGSHTVIRAEGRDVPESTIEQAAILAAVHSKAQHSGQVAVDFTKIRYVSKPGGAKPGFVIYTHQTTVFVKPDEALAQRLSK